MSTDKNKTAVVLYFTTDKLFTCNSTTGYYDYKYEGEGDIHVANYNCFTLPGKEWNSATQKAFDRYISKMFQKIYVGEFEK